MYEEDNVFRYVLPYKVGDIVAIAQPYKDIIESMAEYSDIIINVDGSINREYKAGYTNKMFVKADLMPHHIRITDVKIEHLQDISDKECLREGVKRASIGFYAEGVRVKDWEKQAQEAAKRVEETLEKYHNEIGE